MLCGHNLSRDFIRHICRLTGLALSSLTNDSPAVRSAGCCACPGRPPATRSPGRDPDARRRRTAGRPLRARRTEPVGTVLFRGPYGRGFPFSLIFGALYAARGYRVLMQSVRGTFGSGGIFRRCSRSSRRRRHGRVAAGAAVVHRSLRHHRNFLSGVHPVGAAAGSATGVGCGRHHRRPHDFSDSAWGTGSFTVNDFLGWSYLVAHQEDPGRIRAGIRQLRRAEKRVTRRR